MSILRCRHKSLAFRVWQRADERQRAASKDSLSRNTPPSAKPTLGESKALQKKTRTGDAFADPPPPFQREVARQMSLENAILAANTGEKGTIFTDLQGRARISMPLEKDSISPTNDTEILRGSFAQLLYDATAKHTDWRFGDQITQMEEREDGVDVRFQSGKEETFDLVVLADGVGSRTRKLVFPPEDIQFKKIGVCKYMPVPLNRLLTSCRHCILHVPPGPQRRSIRPLGRYQSPR